MAFRAPLSVDTTGEWSPRQAQAVIAAVQEEAGRHGLRFRAIDITGMGGPERCLIAAFCLKHDCAIAVDSACPQCLSESGGS